MATLERHPSLGLAGRSRPDQERTSLEAERARSDQDAAPAADAALARGIARWLDTAMLDPILGLFLPGAGDLLSSSAGLVVVAMAIRRRLPVIVVARMLTNLAVDAAVGAVPVAGDLFDLVHRAHSKNAALFLARHEHRRASWRDWAAVGGAALAFVVALALPIYVVVKIAGAIF